MAGSFRHLTMFAHDLGRLTGGSGDVGFAASARWYRAGSTAGYCSSPRPPNDHSPLIACGLAPTRLSLWRNSVPSAVFRQHIDAGQLSPVTFNPLPARRILVNNWADRQACTGLRPRTGATAGNAADADRGAAVSPGFRQSARAMAHHPAAIGFHQGATIAVAKSRASPPGTQQRQ
jgi:hypothetical protein